MQDGLGVKIKAFSVDFLSFRKEDKNKKKTTQTGVIARDLSSVLAPRDVYHSYFRTFILFYVCADMHMYIFPVVMCYYHVICEVRYFM